MEFTIWQLLDEKEAAIKLFQDFGSIIKGFKKECFHLLNEMFTAMLRYIFNIILAVLI